MTVRRVWVQAGRLLVLWPLLWLVSWLQLRWAWGGLLGGNESIACATCRFEDDIRLWAAIVALPLGVLFVRLPERSGFWLLRWLLLLAAWAWANDALLSDRMWGVFLPAERLVYQFRYAALPAVLLAAALTGLWWFGRKVLSARFPLFFR
ncbi:MAG: hypothetical protein Q4A62_01875 [Eikenella sp.]|nr:hypothetical protein [Eikenella sp.]